MFDLIALDHFTFYFVRFKVQSYQQQKAVC